MVCIGVQWSDALEGEDWSARANVRMKNLLGPGAPVKIDFFSKEK